MKVNITPTLWTKLNYITNEYEIELGGYLIGEVKHGEIFLQDILIPSQTISSTHVDISHDAQLELRRKYGDKVFKIIGHWHSHHRMGAFWSGTDENNMQTIMQSKKLFVFIVTSTSGFLCRVSIREPIKYDIQPCNLYLKSLDFDLFRKRVDTVMGNHDKNVEKREFEREVQDSLDEMNAVEDEDEKDSTH